MIFANVFPEKTDTGTVEMIAVTPENAVRKLQRQNFKINAAVFGLFLMFLMLVVVVVLLTVDRNRNFLAPEREIVAMREEIKYMKREIEELKFQCSDKITMEELKAFETETSEDITNKLDEYDNQFKSLESEDDDEDDEESAESYRRKRELLATTQDGVPVIAESYVAHQRLKTPASGEKLMLYDTLDGKRSRKMNKSSWTAASAETETPTPSMFTRMSRVMSTDQEKRKLKKHVRKSVGRNGSSENRNIQEQVEPVEEFVPRPRRRKNKVHHRNIESMDEYPAVRAVHRRSVPAIHYHGNSSNIDYKMNHSDGLVAWNIADWAKDLNMNRHFSLTKNKLTVKESGLYLVYAQICYSTKHDQHGFKILKIEADSSSENPQLIAQCVVTSHSKHEKTNTCYTATVDRILEDESIQIEELEKGGRISIFQAGKSFFGLVKLADITK